MASNTFDSSAVEIKNYIQQISSELQNRFTEKPVDYVISALDLSASGLFLIAGDYSGSVILFETNSIKGRDMTTINPQVKIDTAHVGAVNTVKFFNNTDTNYASGGEDGNFYLWNSGEKVFSYSSTGKIAHLLVESNSVWFANYPNKIINLEISRNRLVKERAFTVNTENLRLCKFFTMNKNKKLIYCDEKSINIYNLIRSDMESMLECGEVIEFCYIISLKSVAFSVKTENIVLWDVETDYRKEFIGSAGEWNVLSILDGDVLISAGKICESSYMKFWNIHDYTCIYSFNLESTPLIYCNNEIDESFYLFLECQTLLKVQQKEKLIEKSIKYSDEITDFEIYDGEPFTAIDSKLYYKNTPIDIEHIITCCKIKGTDLVLAYDNTVEIIDVRDPENVVPLYNAYNKIFALDFAQKENWLIVVSRDQDFSDIVIFDLAENVEKKEILNIEALVYQASIVRGVLIYSTDNEIIFYRIEGAKAEFKKEIFAKFQLKFCVYATEDIIFCAGNNEIIDFISIGNEAEPENIIFHGISSSFDTKKSKPKFGIENLKNRINSIAVNSSGLFLIVSKDDSIQFWNINDEIMIWDYQLLISSPCKIRVSQQSIFLNLQNEIIIIRDPTYIKYYPTPSIKTYASQSFTQRNYEKVMILGPNRSSLYFLGAISDISNDQTVDNYDSRIYEWVAFPHCLNILHIFSYIQNATLIQKAFANMCPFIRMVNGCSPLTVGLNTNNKEIIEIIVCEIAKTIEKTEENSIEREKMSKMIARIENDLPRVNNASPPSLSKIYDLAFRVIFQTGLKRHGCLINPNGVFLTDSSYLIDQNRFLLDKKQNIYEETNLVYRVSSFRMNFSLGSSEGLQFLESLCNCSDNDAFKTQIVQFIVLYKWEQVKYYIFLHNLLYLLFAISTLYYVAFTVEFSYFWHFFIFVINSFLLVYEWLQMSKSYLSNLWNILDIFRIIIVYLFLVAKYYFFYPEKYFDNLTEKRTYQLILVLVVGLTLLRGLSFFECYQKTRSMIKIFVDIIKDSIPFLLVLSCTTLAFTFIFMIIDINLDFGASLTDAYCINFGGFNTDNYGVFQLIIFHLATLINPLLMLNLLVSIMNETFSRLKENLITEDIKALAELVVEHESVIFWKKNRGHKKFLQSCSPETIGYIRIDKRSKRLEMLGETVDQLHNSMKQAEKRWRKKVEDFENKISKQRKEEITLYRTFNKDEADFRNKVSQI
ncbi:hypothetical protein SteCoe_32313 [Stentor coeruleus]|uniref:Ion transport domain-containing protein n=1 Tax=Stentor coeruleus TaxID=5963 RepID=A0A1R2AZE2_9CILI|nr:hypothetical protein SteCoe_32313 [Stentor coeruleus]